MSFTKTQLQFMSKMMDMLGDELSNHGCNDYQIPCTQENIEFCVDLMTAVEDPEYQEDLSISPDGTQIYLMDWQVAAYCHYLIERELKNYER